MLLLRYCLVLDNGNMLETSGMLISGFVRQIVGVGTARNRRKYTCFAALCCFVRAARAAGLGPAELDDDDDICPA